MTGRVAPLAGAWIETKIGANGLLAEEVAPLAGAWIETNLGNVVKYVWRVAPLAGAWIETTTRSIDGTPARSRPSRARGLKRRDRLLSGD